jgi:hypothetical protein
MQATLDGSKDRKADAPSGKEIEESDARRIEENEQRKLDGKKTVGGIAGRAQVADKDPKGMHAGCNPDRSSNRSLLETCVQFRWSRYHTLFTRELT